MDLRDLTATQVQLGMWHERYIKQLVQYDPFAKEMEERGKYYADLQASEEKRKKEWVNREVAMQAARRIETIEELANGLEVGINDDYLRGAYYCRMVELQPMLSPVGRLIAERYIDKYKEIV